MILRYQNNFANGLHQECVLNPGVCHMPKYRGKQIFTHRRFPEVGQKQKTETKKREKERKKEKLNDGNNNDQLRIATPPRVVHTKPPGPKRAA